LIHDLKIKSATLTLALPRQGGGKKAIKKAFFPKKRPGQYAPAMVIS